MLRHAHLLSIVLAITLLGCQKAEEPQATNQETTIAYSSDSYDDLVSLFKEWRALEKPPLKDGAPDYTKATFQKRWSEFKALQAKLNAIDKSGWPTNQQVDWYIVWRSEER
ncbi:MAG: hypothetical protein RIB63_01280, partial [Fulvivirga sp.]